MEHEEYSVYDGMSEQERSEMDTFTLTVHGMNYEQYCLTVWGG
jgi:hypothetical protein